MEFILNQEDENEIYFFNFSDNEDDEDYSQNSKNKSLSEFMENTLF